MGSWTDELTEEIEFEKPRDRPVVATILAGFGALLIVVGVACIYWPAGIIVAGVCALGASLLAVYLEKYP